MHPNDLLVSIIMPVYNAEKYISESIQSVFNQSFSGWELIIINDGSTDRTVDLVKDFVEKDARIKLLNQSNKKQAAARNLGLKAATGNWIAFLDADDIWMPEKLAIQLRYIDKADIIYTGGDILYQNENKLVPYNSLFGNHSGLEMYEKLFMSNPIPNLSVMMRHELIGKVGLQDEALDVVGCEDWDYWIRIAHSDAAFVGIADKLFTYRVHSEGTSDNRLKMRMAEVYATFPNYDSKLISTSILKSRIRNFIRPLILDLIKIGHYAQAIKIIEVVLGVNRNFKLLWVRGLLRKFRNPPVKLIQLFLK